MFFGLPVTSAEVYPLFKILNSYQFALCYHENELQRRFNSLALALTESKPHARLFWRSQGT
jgi:hypothetical protein